MKTFRIPAGPGQAEIEIKKSRFIADVWPVESEEDVQLRLERVRKEHKKASHHVYAYRLGDDDNHQRFNDDGEPGGTAGRPVLDVIRGENLYQVLVVVTRYFGGTLLGSGGLVRAYSQAAREGIQAAGYDELSEQVQCRIILSYPYAAKAEYLLSREPLLISDTIYAEQVTYIVNVPSEHVESVRSFLIDLSGGKVEFHVENSVFLPMKA